MWGQLTVRLHSGPRGEADDPWGHTMTHTYMIRGPTLEHKSDGDDPATQQQGR